MHVRSLTSGAVVLGCVLAAQSASATTFLSGDIRSNATYKFGLNSASDPRTASIAAPGSILVSSAVGYSNGHTLSVASSVEASWDSADSGTIDMTWGWNIDTIGSPLAFAAATWTIAQTPAPGWSYSFVASGDGVFTLNYKITPTSFTFGLHRLTGIGGLADINLQGSSVVQDSHVVALVAGQSYTFGLQNNGNVSNSGGSWLNSRAIGEFDWAITYDTVTAVPEPASWATMICGLGLVGASLRRRRNASGPA